MSGKRARMDFSLRSAYSHGTVVLRTHIDSDPPQHRISWPVVAEMREHSNATPVLFLSALSEVDDRVKGLKAGGDDYLTKPYAFVELLARIDALMRRRSPSSVKTRARNSSPWRSIILRMRTHSTMSVPMPTMSGMIGDAPRPAPWPAVQ